MHVSDTRDMFALPSEDSQFPKQIFQTIDQLKASFLGLIESCAQYGKQFAAARSVQKSVDDTELYVDLGPGQYGDVTKTRSSSYSMATTSNAHERFIQEIVRQFIDNLLNELSLHKAMDSVWSDRQEKGVPRTTGDYASYEQEFEEITNLFRLIAAHSDRSKSEHLIQPPTEHLLDSVLTSVSRLERTRNAYLGSVTSSYEWRELNQALGGDLELPERFVLPPKDASLPPASFDDLPANYDEWFVS